MPSDFEKSARIQRDGSANASFAVPWYLRLSDDRDLPCRCVGERSCRVELAARCRWGLIAWARGDVDAADDVAACRNFPLDENLVTISISGGGMRSAVFARAVMRELDELGILKHVDVVSGVSGGAIATALYGLSCDREADCETSMKAPVEPLLWSEPEIDRRLQRDVLMLGFASVLAPWNLLPYAFTDYSRTDLFANAMAAGIYPRGPGLAFDTLPHQGRRFSELNALRPNVLIGATIMTEPPPPNPSDQKVRLRTGTGGCFHFTLEDFEDLRSDLASYPLANAVAASSAFPGVFYPIVIEQFQRDAETGRRRFLHLQDGGIRDQPAVSPVTEILFNLFPRAGSVLAYRVPLDFCDISRAGRRADVQAEPYSLPPWVLSALNGSALASASETNLASDAGTSFAPLVPQRIINIFIDASAPTQGLSRTSPTAWYDFADSIFGHRKIIEPVNVIIDEQRTIRAAEYVQLRYEIIRSLSTPSALAELTREPERVDPELCCQGIIFSIHDFYVGHRQSMTDEACDIDSLEEDWAALRGIGDRGLYAFSVEDTSGCQAKDSPQAKAYERLLELGLDFSINKQQFKEINTAAKDLVARMAKTLCLPAHPEANGQRYLFGNAAIPCNIGTWADPSPQ